MSSENDGANGAATDSKAAAARIAPLLTWARCPWNQRIAGLSRISRHTTATSQATLSTLSTSLKQPAPGAIKRLLAGIGPGVITGAADDDPSGIATYSIAGAQLGTSLLWTALLTWPLMAVVQMMCARIGLVTGQGLAGNFKQRFPRWLLGIFVIALLAANTINIAADLAGMADAAGMLSGVKAHFFVVVFAL